VWWLILLFVCFVFIPLFLKVRRFQAETTESLARTERERAIAATKTATELWVDADARIEESADDWIPLKPSGSEKLAREYLIWKYGDNVRAYNAWRAAGKGKGSDGNTALFAEVMAWNKDRKS
jgi:hypothetical protein